jgi:competence protein ComEC
MKYLFFLIISLSATLISKDLKTHSEFIIWNVGQGQWTTLVTEKNCDHFDMGGEINLTRKVKNYCGPRQHRIHLSHWDSDHINFIAKLRKQTQNLCLYAWPRGEASAHKKLILAGLPFCEMDQKNYDLIYSGSKNSKAKSNDLSEVVATHGILIPGDSPKKEEKIWSVSSQLSLIKGLVLSHHGSHTSTSEQLLAHLPNLKWAIASARKKRFGHPHPDTLKLLKKYHIPVLLTEDWGSIIIRLE